MALEASWRCERLWPGVDGSQKIKNCNKADSTVTGECLGLKMRVRTIYKVKVLSHLMKRRSEQGAVTSGDLHPIRGARPGMSGVECGRLRAESCQIRGILCGIVKK